MVTDEFHQAVLLFGAPGSGKGTVGKLMEPCVQVPHISTGDILREHVNAHDALGDEVKDMMGIGKLVPDELVNQMVADRVRQPDCCHGFILDGYPRTLEQARFLSQLLDAKGLEPVVVHLLVDYNKIIARLTARRSCPVCGTVYNLESRPPLKDDVCDTDGTALVIREDDREEVIRQRLEAYERQSRPLEEYFVGRVKKLYLVDGNKGTPEEIATRTCGLIKSE